MPPFWHFVYWYTLDVDTGFGTRYDEGVPYTLTVDNDGQPLYTIIQHD
jgi:hypothetical protein